MVLSELCSPALIYLVFSIVQISIDTLKQQYNVAFMKTLVAFLFTLLLNNLCVRGLGVVSWIIVFIPFVLMTLVISILLYVFGLNPTTGRVMFDDKTQPPSEYVDARIEAAKENAITTKSTSKPIADTAADYDSTKQTPEVNDTQETDEPKQTSTKQDNESTSKHNYTIKEKSITTIYNY